MASMLRLLRMEVFQHWTQSHQLCVPRCLQRLTITPSYMLTLLPWRAPGLLGTGICFHKVVSTDAFLKGRGALCDGVSVRGVWTSVQHEFHINHLKLHAALLLACCFFSSKAFLSCSDRPAGSDQDRQYNSGFQYKQAGRDLLTCPVKTVSLSNTVVVSCSFRATHVPSRFNQQQIFSAGEDLL